MIVLLPASSKRKLEKSGGAFGETRVKCKKPSNGSSRAEGMTGEERKGQCDYLLPELNCHRISQLKEETCSGQSKVISHEMFTSVIRLGMRWKKVCFA